LSGGDRVTAAGKSQAASATSLNEAPTPPTSKAYLNDQSTSQYNLAALTAGQPANVIEGKNVGYTDRPGGWIP
jgi:hypothetical protein